MHALIDDDSEETADARLARPDRLHGGERALVERERVHRLGGRSRRPHHGWKGRGASGCLAGSWWRGRISDERHSWWRGRISGERRSWWRGRISGERHGPRGHIRGCG